MNDNGGGVAAHLTQICILKKEKETDSREKWVTRFSQPLSTAMEEMNLPTESHHSPWTGSDNRIQRKLQREKESQTDSDGKTIER